uniref:Glycosyltransferase n=1 Tax=Fagus sylvatica TaxID=28930 RepID=A0A2N9FUS0_FAGSY
MASIISQPHFVLIPLMAQGHMIPMIDMARLFAERGVIVSLVTTPYNASRFDTTINRATESGLPIRLVQIEFSCQEVGLPKGYENLDILPSPDLLRKFYKALSLLQKPLENYLEKQNPPPTCIISDKSLFWTSKTAQKFNIPRLVFHGMGCFSLLSSHNIKHYNAHQSVTSDSEPFMISRDKIQEAESTAYGVVVNSFDELEHECIEGYKKAINKKVWCVGPVSLCNKENLDKFERGNKAPIDFQQCLEWLNSMKPRSVIYACLGSLCRLLPSQLIELGLGLEASNQPFIWVIKTGEELENWFVKENFEERIKGRGLLIRGWAPQVFILSHPSIGGFITHCGWNSIIESMCSGLPIITWPLFAEQFFNEKLVVEILRIGVRVGVDIPVRWGEEERVGVLVKKYEVEKAIAMLMDEGEEGEKRRKKARELGEMARKAMEKGGSSELNMSFLIEDITKQSTMIV